MSKQEFSKPILITGATGFLGRAVIARLLASTPAELIAPVRATSQQMAQERGAETLRSALDREPTAAEAARIRWVRGDIEEAQLGMSDSMWQAVATTTHDIIHCAASVRFDLDLDEAQRINVDGTAHLLELAVLASRLGGFGCFHHVSTAYAAGTASGLVDADHLPADSAGNFRNTYERTKARAERLLREQDRVEVAIYRPSIVGGDSVDGETDNWNVLYAPMRMIANGQLPVMPNSGLALVDSVGVDYVADGIVTLAQSDRGDYVGHHLTAGPDAFNVSQFVDTSVAISKLFGRTPSEPQLVGPARWAALTTGVGLAARAPKSAPKVRRWGRLGERGLKGFAPYSPYTGVSTRFDNRRERLMLGVAGVSMPPALDYLETIATYAIGTNFGKQPLVTNDVSAVVDGEPAAPTLIEGEPVGGDAAEGEAVEVAR